MARFAAAAAAVAVAVAYNNGLGSTPPRGWSTWCTDDLCGLLDLCFEQEIHQVRSGRAVPAVATRSRSRCAQQLRSLATKIVVVPLVQIADSMNATGMISFGYNLILLDDCWAADTRDALGNIQPDPTRFPSGMADLADYVHGKGLKLGLYTCAGEKTCKFNRTGSLYHEAEDAATFAGWNIDYVKEVSGGHHAGGLQRASSHRPTGVVFLSHTRGGACACAGCRTTAGIPTPLPRITTGT